jgi:hypothetical protein
MVVLNKDVEFSLPSCGWGVRDELGLGLFRKEVLEDVSSY